MGTELTWIGFGFFIVGMMLFVFLDFEIESLNDYFKKHPTAFEICIQLMSTGVPLGLILPAFQKWNLAISNDILGLIIMMVIVWPPLMYGIHKGINKHAIALGITSKKFGIIDTILFARLSILGWILSLASIFSALVITQIGSLSFLIMPLTGLGFLGTISFPLLEPISILRKKDESTEEKKDNQEIS